MTTYANVISEEKKINRRKTGKFTIKETHKTRKILKKKNIRKNKMIKLQKCRKYILYILYRHLNMKTKGEEQTKK